jgi:hypothetical protein
MLDQDYMEVVEVEQVRLVKILQALLLVMVEQDLQIVFQEVQ